MRRLLIRITIAAALVVTNPVSARADGTLLIGVLTIDDSRPSISFAFGYLPSVVGFEIEYVGTLGSAGHSSAGGIFGNIVVQPVTIGQFQFFAVGGFGLWGEKFADGRGTGALDARDIGGGVKIGISERSRIRLDYRLFLLGEPEGASGVPSTMRPHRFSGGLHLVF